MTLVEASWGLWRRFHEEPWWVTAGVQTEAVVIYVKPNQKTRARKVLPADISGHPVHVKTMGKPRPL